MHSGFYVSLFILFPKTDRDLHYNNTSLGLNMLGGVVDGSSLQMMKFPADI
jgi:hypothetical protein